MPVSCAAQALRKLAVHLREWVLRPGSLSTQEPVGGLLQIFPSHIWVRGTLLGADVQPPSCSGCSSTRLPLHLGQGCWGSCRTVIVGRPCWACSMSLSQEHPEAALRWLQLLPGSVCLGSQHQVATKCSWGAPLSMTNGIFPQEGKEFAESKRLLFMEASARLNHQVTEVFSTVGEWGPSQGWGSHPGSASRGPLAPSWGPPGCP